MAVIGAGVSALGRVNEARASRVLWPFLGEALVLYDRVRTAVPRFRGRPADRSNGGERPGMYTGITQGTFEVVGAERVPDLLRYEVALPASMIEGLVPGASVSIDGVCQTVVTLTDEGRVTFEAIAETLDLTTLSELQVGQRVAVERSARVGDEVGGHDVAGHVIGTGEILEVVQEGHVCDLLVGVSPEWLKYILPKGFVAVDGSSLTVGRLDSGKGFWLHLIPETLRLTNLGKKAQGARVNVELDSRTVAIVDTVERVMAERSGV